jgi:DNA mismatch endonuclease (patch repair protein)
MLKIGMADVFSKKKRSEVMSKIRSRGNATTELKAVRLFKEYKIKGWRRGKKLLGNPDFVFPKGRVALFVDGCYWHGCPAHGHIAKSNAKYWEEKMARNKRRDRLVGRTLRKEGWKVVRIWEHWLKQNKLPKGVLEILKKVA